MEGIFIDDLYPRGTDPNEMNFDKVYTYDLYSYGQSAQSHNYIVVAEPNETNFDKVYSYGLYSYGEAAPAQRDELCHSI